MIFARPEQFHYPVLVSSVAVLTAGGLYALFARRRRGHLLHFSSCMPLVSKGREEGRSGDIARLEFSGQDY
jgi:solute carrier family 40 (iron-regulated transporter), member 1